MLPGENRGGFKKQNKGKKNASLEPGNKQNLGEAGGQLSGIKGEVAFFLPIVSEIIILE